MSFSAHQIGKFHELEEEGKPIEQADETNNCSSNPNKAQIISIDAPDITLQELDSISVYSSMRNIALNSLPSIVAMIIEYSIFSLNIVFVGYLDDPISMSGCGLGGITATILVYSVGVGMCGGIDTLVSQAFGRKEFELCKIYLNVSKIAMTLLFIPQLILIFFSEDLFILIGQPIESSNVACRYLIICLPGLFLNTQFECTRRYLLAMGVYYPTTIINH